MRVRLTVGDSQDITDAILAGELAMGVVGAHSTDPDLAFTPLVEDELIIVAAKKLPGIQDLCADGEPRISPDDIRSWPWVLREPGSGTRKAFETALADIGLDIRGLNTVIEARSHETVVQCAVHGLGLCVTSKLAVGQFLSKGELVAVDVPGLDMRRSFYIVRHAKRHVFPAMRYFMDFLENPKE